MKSKDKEILKKIDMYKHDIVKTKSKDYIAGFNDALDLFIKIIEYIIS